MKTHLEIDQALHNHQERIKKLERKHKSINIYHAHKEESEHFLETNEEALKRGVIPGLAGFRSWEETVSIILKEMEVADNHPQRVFRSTYWIQRLWEIQAGH